ncbi:serine/threonine-protein kinase [Piscinibacter terrae]|uniref:Serine/threonine protein kinase n=1 Tax=Piscinibacter terrae TaxID=2496871 RepID=A0A3N7HK09_9BURK|nr:serine/threonine-protein kinase [Albitalea terrae]RQP21306.1 serine/threonine protein kinase [Albitalea terrae]
MSRELSVAQLAALSRLWDEAQALSEQERAAWLAAMEGEDAGLRPMLERMLAAASADDTSAFLHTLPKVIDPDHAASRGAGPAEGRSVGGYRLLRRLGAGGMGAVWLAERSDGLIKRPVALKLPHPWLVDTQSSEHFKRECEILAALTHPHIARLYDAGIDASGQTYLALEYVEGKTLTERCNADALTIRQRLELFLDVLEAVGHAHAQRIVHRDLKPSNILVTPDGQVRLLDFGIAKLLKDDGNETATTQTAFAALTPSYASPEQITGQPTRTSADIYSLGVILYEMLAGQGPYRVKNPTRASVEAAILGGDIEPPSRNTTAEHARHCATPPAKLSSELRGDLDTIVLTALKRAPHERYVSVQALADDIARYLRGEPVLARPDGMLYRYGKLLSKHRVEAGALAAVFLSLTIGLVAALWQAEQARQQSRIAQQQSDTAEAALKFLEDIFGANSKDQPDPAKARTTTARELLDAGARRIDSSLNDTPEAKRRLLGTLSHMYNELELPDEAAALFRKRLELTKSLYPSGDPAVLDEQIQLAYMSIGATGQDQARPMLSDALKTLDQKGDRTSSTRARLELALAVLLKLEAAPGDLDEAVAHADAAVRILKAQKPSTDLAETLLEQGNVLYAMGRYTSARASLIEGVQVAQSLDMNPADVADIQMQLCLVEADLGNAAAAEPLCRQAITTHLAKGAGDDVAMLDNAQFAGVLFNSARLREGLALMKGLHVGQGKAPPATPFGYSAEARARLGDGLTRFGDIDEALENLQAADKMDVVAWKRPRVQRFVLPRLAACYAELGRFTQAADTLQQAETRLSWGAKRNSPSYNTLMMVRAQLALAQGQAAEATAAAAAFQLPEGETTVTSPDALEQLTLLAEADVASQRFEQALSRSRQLQERVRASAHPQHSAAWVQRMALVEGRALLQSGQVAQAIEPLQRALQMGQQLLGANSPWLADAHVWLGLAQFKHGERNMALNQVAAAAAIHAAHKELGFHHRSLLAQLQHEVDHR